MIVTRGLGQAPVLGALVASGLGIAGVADVIVTLPTGGGGGRYVPVLKRPPRHDDDDVLLMLMTFFTSGAVDEPTELPQ